jgi:glutathione S-transferase
MKLHYCPRTRAFTALWMMEEAGQPYKLARIDIRGPGHPSDAYKKINPMGKVPGFQDGDCAMGETAAILLYVADKFPQTKLAPPPTDPKRGRFLQWLIFSSAVLEPAMVEKRLGQTPNPVQSGWGDYDRAMSALEGAMKPGQWLQGDRFTAADLYIGSSLGFGMRFGMIDKRPSFVEFAERAAARPAFKRAGEIDAREDAIYQADKEKWLKG